MNAARNLAYAPSVAELDRELVRQCGLLEFARLAWPEVEAGEFVPNWHLEEVAAHLEAVTRGEIRRLVINVPPGCMKSLLVSVLWPAWEWTVRPQSKWIHASYSADLSRRDAVRMRNLVTSPWYRARWPQVTLPLQNTRSAMFFQNSRRGFRFSTSVEGGVTGRHADRIVVDDPTKPLDVAGGGETARNALAKTRAWWSTTMATRRADPKTTAFVIIMQRLHENDLAGELLKAGDYVHLRLPMRYEASAPCATPVGGDHRTEDGELLWPERFPLEEVDQIERDMGSQVTAAQHQQRPSPEGGAIFRREWLANYWRELPAHLRLIQSWDMSFKRVDGASYVAGGVWGTDGARFYLVDQWRARATFSEAKAAVRTMTAKWPRALLKLIEDKANGTAIEDALKVEIPGIVLVNPRGGKEARANAVAPLFEAGNVCLPHPDRAPWVHDYVEELVAFPMGANDDQVDQTTQALTRLHVRRSGLNRLKQAMQNARTA